MLYALFHALYILLAGSMANNKASGPNGPFYWILPIIGSTLVYDWCRPGFTNNSCIYSMAFAMVSPLLLKLGAPTVVVPIIMGLFYPFVVEITCLWKQQRFYRPILFVLVLGAPRTLMKAYGVSSAVQIETLQIASVLAGIYLALTGIYLALTGHDTGKTYLSSATWKESRSNAFKSVLEGGLDYLAIVGIPHLGNEELFLLSCTAFTCQGIFLIMMNAYCMWRDGSFAFPSAKEIVILLNTKKQEIESIYFFVQTLRFLLIVVARKPEYFAVIYVFERLLGYLANQVRERNALISSDNMYNVTRPLSDLCRNLKQLVRPVIRSLERALEFSINSPSFLHLNIFLNFGVLLAKGNAILPNSTSISKLLGNSPRFRKMTIFIALCAIMYPHSINNTCSTGMQNVQKNKLLEFSGKSSPFFSRDDNNKLYLVLAYPGKSVFSPVKTFGHTLLIMCSDKECMSAGKTGRQMGNTSFLGKDPMIMSKKTGEYLPLTVYVLGNITIGKKDFSSILKDFNKTYTTEWQLDYHMTTNNCLHWVSEILSKYGGELKTVLGIPRFTRMCLPDI